MKYKLTFALVASLTSTAFAEFKAPLPEFKNEKQLAEWRAEKGSEATSQDYTTEETVFYTGKPYLASSGGYAFKYRSYNPELARWTSEDPSGYPDGANGSIYAPTPTSGVDFSGLWKIVMTSIGNGNGEPGNTNTSQYYWDRTVGGLTGSALLTSDTAPNVKADSITISTTGTASYSGHPDRTVTHTFVISLNSDNKFKMVVNGDPAVAAGGLGVNAIGNPDGANTRDLTLAYGVGVAYGGNGLTAGGISILGSGINFEWENATTSFGGLRSITFEVVE